MDLLEKIVKSPYAHKLTSKTVYTVSLLLSTVWISPSFALSDTYSQPTNTLPNHAISQAAPTSPVLIKLLPSEISVLNCANDPVDDLLATDRPNLLAAIDNSLRYIRTNTAAKRYPVAGISSDRIEKSLIRFRQLVETSPTANALHESVMREFDLYKSVGLDKRGTVHFTGYFEAVFPASRTRTNEYKYPLYRLPNNFSTWKEPHPTREELETGNLLKGTELVWLRDRFQAFLVHVQGSARLQLPDNSVMTVGYAGKTTRPYNSIGKELVQDGKMRLEDVTLQALIAYFQNNPQDLDKYLKRNQSFVFFRETNGSQAMGSIGTPVTAERSIATDKSIMPPGAIALIRTSLPILNKSTNKLQNLAVSRFVLDQDTGGAIKGAGRVDIFMGTGSLAQNRAGLINTDGELYYLVLK